jgi:cysteine-rich repeat protein
MGQGRWLVPLLVAIGCYQSTRDDDEDLPNGDAPARLDGAPKVDARPFEPPPPNCGDGTLDADEECDDGNADDGDACVRCRGAVCGDGALRRVFEQCDDGNDGQDDGCTSLCLQCDAATQFAGTGGHCYSRIDTLRPFNEASVACGFGYLVVHGTLGSQTTVFDAVLAGTTGPYWFGLHDTRVEGTFEWMNFATLGYTDWDTGQPDDGAGAGADCMAIAVSTADWRDYDCATARKALCEDDGAWSFGADGHGYRVIWGRATFDEAVSICADRGGYIAALTTPDEAAIVLAQVPADPRVRAWIGANDRTTEGSFVWTTGEAFSYAGWAAGQPAADGDCAALAADLGGWDDVSCTGRRPFVCEVE